MQSEKRLAVLEEFTRPGAGFAISERDLDLRGAGDRERARWRRRVGWTRRWRDLAALDATLADDLATPRERLLALRAYLRASRTPEEFKAYMDAETAKWTKVIQDNGLHSD